MKCDIKVAEHDIRFCLILYIYFCANIFFRLNRYIMLYSILYVVARIPGFEERTEVRRGHIKIFSFTCFCLIIENMHIENQSKALSKNRKKLLAMRAYATRYVFTLK